MSAINQFARREPGYEARVRTSLTLLEQAAAAHAGAIVQVTSLGAEGMVITDLIARHRLDIPVATLVTGKLHPQTDALVPRIRQRYGIDVQRCAPRHDTALRFVRRHGDDAMYRSSELRLRCCELRKLQPLARLLKDKKAWITGLRREQSDARAGVDPCQRDAEGRLKVAPLADWSWADVWHYIDTHDVPYNPLHDQGFPSIGCAPCTRAITAGEPFRAGRWWWEGDQAKECGLHRREASPVEVRR